MHCRRSVGVPTQNVCACSVKGPSQRHWAETMNDGDVTLLQNLVEEVKMSREYALLGNYATAAVYFETAQATLQVCLSQRAFGAPRSQSAHHQQNFLRTCTGKHRTKWMKLKDNIMREAELVQVSRHATPRWEHDCGRTRTHVYRIRQELDKEVGAFRESAGSKRPGPSNAGSDARRGDSRRVRPTPDSGRDPFGGLGPAPAPAPADDPDVWPPPTPRSPTRAKKPGSGNRDLPDWARREARDARAKYVARVLLYHAPVLPFWGVLL